MDGPLMYQLLSPMPTLLVPRVFLSPSFFFKYNFVKQMYKYATITYPEMMEEETQFTTRKELEYQVLKSIDAEAQTIIHSIPLVCLFDFDCSRFQWHKKGCEGVLFFYTATREGQTTYDIFVLNRTQGAHFHQAITNAMNVCVEGSYLFYKNNFGIPHCIWFCQGEFCATIYSEIKEAIRSINLSNFSKMCIYTNPNRVDHYTPQQMQNKNTYSRQGGNSVAEFFAKAKTVCNGPRTQFSGIRPTQDHQRQVILKNLKNNPAYDVHSIEKSQMNPML